MNEGYLPGADDVDDEGLRAKGFQEPPRLKHRGRRPEKEQEDAESGEVEQGADGADEKHEFLDVGHVPRPGAFQEFFVDVVGGDGHLGEVV